MRLHARDVFQDVSLRMQVRVTYRERIEGIHWGDFHNCSFNQSMNQEVHFFLNIQSFYLIYQNSHYNFVFIQNTSDCLGESSSCTVSGPLIDYMRFYILEHAMFDIHINLCSPYDYSQLKNVVAMTGQKYLFYLVIKLLRNVIVHICWDSLHFLSFLACFFR